MTDDFRHGDAPPEADPADATPFEDQLQRLVRMRASLERERSRAPALLAELLALPPGAQLDLVSGEPRFRNWGVLELLMEQSTREEERAPTESGRLAFLVLAAADSVDDGRHAAVVIEDMKARAWTAVGESRRRAGARLGAEDAMRRAAGCLLYGTGDVLVEARLLELEAALRRDQGLPGEALSLLKRASTRYLEAHEFRLLARALTRREEMLRDTGADEDSDLPSPGETRR
jgi:hypothetical protein